MDKGATRAAIPYVVGLGVAAVLYYYARQIEYDSRPGMLGPDFWPLMAIAMMAVVCLFEIVRIVAGMRLQTQGVAETLEGEHSEQPAPTYPQLLIGGVILVGVYAVAVEVVGFLLCTFLFLVAFMYLGRYRNHIAIWGFSAGVTLLAALVFVRLAYVSLPRGIPPFDAVSDFVRIMLGG